nr:hypothetical protein [uncultured Hyphomonas sp.]
MANHPSNLPDLSWVKDAALEIANTAYRRKGVIGSNERSELDGSYDPVQVFGESFQRACRSYKTRREQQRSELEAVANVLKYEISPALENNPLPEIAKRYKRRTATHSIELTLAWMAWQFPQLVNELYDKHYTKPPLRLPHPRLGEFGDAPSLGVSESGAETPLSLTGGGESSLNRSLDFENPNAVNEQLFVAAADQQEKVKFEQLAFHQQMAEALGQGYQPHRVERDFETFIVENDCGYWELVSEAGKGKSSILASLYRRARELSPNARAGIHFFRKFPGHPNENGVPNAVHGLLAQIQMHGMTTPPKPQGYRHAASTFENWLQVQASQGRIGKTKPVILFVDGLDEIFGEGTPVPGAQLPEWMPSQLPEGVFIAFSRRSVDFDVEAPPEEQRRSHAYVRLEDPKHKSDHQRSVLQFALNLLGADAAPDRGEIEKRAAEYCRLLDYNPLMLRALLSDNGVRGTPIPDNILEDELPGFYRHLVFRMTNRGDKHGPEARMLCAFAFLPDIPRQLWLRVGGDQATSRVEVQRTIDRWISQGLLVGMKRGQDDWYSPLHSTFRRHAETVLANADRTIYAEPLAENLTNGVDLTGKLGEVFDFPPDVREGWIVVVLQALVAAQRTHSLGELLHNLAFWKLCGSTQGGIFTPLQKLARIAVSGPMAEAFRSTLERSAIRLLELSDGGELKDRLQRPLSRADLVRTAARADPGNMDEPFPSLPKALITLA